MEDEDNFMSCNFDSDTPIYVGQPAPVIAEQDDDDDASLKAIYSRVLIADRDGSTQAQSNLGQDDEPQMSPPITSLISSEKQSDDHPSLDPPESSESCRALNNASPEKLSMSRWDADTLVRTRDYSCNGSYWVDEYSDDEEIRVGHERKKEDTPTNDILKFQSNEDCKKRLLEDLSKLECSTVGTAENNNVDLDYLSSASNVTHSEHLSRSETLSGADLDRTCDENAKIGCELGDLSCLSRGNSETYDEQEHQRPSNHDRPHGTKVEPESKECTDKLVNSIILPETPQMLASKGESDATDTPGRARGKNVPKAQKIISESELQTTSNETKEKTIECQSYETVECSPASKSYSLRNKRRRTSFQKDTINSKPKTPLKESIIASCKGQKATCNEYKEKEGISLSVTRRTSPRKQEKIDDVEDHSRSKDVQRRDENVNSKIAGMVDEQEKNDSLIGKERTSTSRRGIVNIDILDQSSGLCNDFEVADCEVASSQIYTGAPMFSLSKTRKRSCRGKGSFSPTQEDVTAVGEGIQINVGDTPNKRVASTNPQTEQIQEGETRNSNEEQSNNSYLNPACVLAMCPSPEVLKSSNRQRRRKLSAHEQNETTVTENELINAGTRKEEKTSKRTRKVNKKCETSKKQKCLGNKGDAIHASIERPQETAHIENNTEAPENLEKLEGPTPPDTRPVYRARRCPARGRKSVYDLINDLTAASASALKRVSESTSTPSSKENQESSHTGQTEASKKGRVTKARQSRKRKYRGCSPGEDDPQLSDPVKPETNSSYPSLEPCATVLWLNSLSDDSGDDDDDELMNPVLTPDSKNKDLPPAFSINDVVWAQDPADKLRWPTVVIEVAGENVSRRVYNVFKTNQAKEQFFQVKSSRYLKPYNCKEKKTYLEKGKGMNEFNKAVEKADNFIMKIGLGKVDSYEDFFTPSDAYLDSLPPSPDYTSPPSPLLIVGHNIPEYSPSCLKTSPHVLDDDDDDDEKEEEEEEEEEEENLNDSLHIVKSNSNGTSKEFTNLKRKWQRKEKRLLEHMRSSQTKEYLVGIQQGREMSHRHQWFLSSNPIDKGRLLRGSCGALINEKKRFGIVDYLRDLLSSDKSLLSSPRYMMDVALPEALNFAYQKTNRVDKDDAEQLIHMDGQQVIRDLDIG